MKRGGDKLVTNPQGPDQGGNQRVRAGRGSKGKPVATVKFGSAAVPIYRTQSGRRVRFTISHYRHGKRLRQAFPTLNAAKREAQLVAQRIQSGMQHVTDMKAQDREAYLAACRMIEEFDVPLVSAIEDYVRCRRIAGAESLAAMAADYSKHFGHITRRANVPEVVEHLLINKQQDGVGKRHLGQIRSVLRRFAAAHPVPILEVTSADIDAWIRSLDVGPSSRNAMLRYLNILFTFALEQRYLPEGKPTATSQLKKVKVTAGDVRIFPVDQFRTLIHAAPPHLVPLLSIGSFAGIRMAEILRLDWSAVDLQRRIIEIRPGQAKTASRRIVPVTGNLAAWLDPLPRHGRVVPSGEILKESTALARALGIEWPRNVLRHSFISYRIAAVKSADQVALEAGNSPAIIFKHYHELTTEEQAAAWFSTLPKPGQWENAHDYDKKKRIVTLKPTVYSI